VKKAKAALTSGRRCSRGRLGVDVHGGGAFSAPAPETRTTVLLGTARRGISSAPAPGTRTTLLLGTARRALFFFPPLLLPSPPPRNGALRQRGKTPSGLVDGPQRLGRRV
jgi:hypothetical protein